MSERKWTGKRIVGVILNVILVCMVLYIGATLCLRLSTGNSHASLFGFTTHVVISESMEPNINKNDIIFVKKQKTYAIGDVVTYIDADGRSITHRIIAIDISGYTLKGDDNSYSDPGIISADQIIGKVIAMIPHDGGWIQKVPNNINSSIK